MGMKNFKNKRVLLDAYRKRHEKCSYADQYKGLIEPKCGCDACWQKWCDVQQIDQHQRG